MTGFGVYVHVPFCRHRCDYCAFATYTDRDHLMGRYVDGCVTQLRRAADAGDLPPATSVFFGGGTPSRLPAADLCRILAAIPLATGPSAAIPSAAGPSAAGPRAPGAEVTVECNPEDVTAERLAAYRDGGVTRISLGVQSTVPHVLAGLGRRHDPDVAFRAAALVAEAGFDSWNLDLIFGGAAEDDADWARSLRDLLSLPHPPPHLSAYALTVEPGTPLAADPGRHPDDDVQAGRYEVADAVLSAAGYRWEEISNWALPGHGCRHNRLYWAQGDYLGVGSAAHSHRAGRRWWNLRTPDRYVAAVEADRAVVAGEEVLTEQQRAFERLALSLRTPDGVPMDALDGVDQLVADGLVAPDRGRAVLTVRGRLVANAVTARLQERRSATTILPVHDQAGRRRHR
ncbi:MAG TPA: radical SAM family heme chaperone HemW [Acidimicrobiales bacterium]|nr:radical SAM family heme chaperone HemW [Acidimicrobiales bacterium]